MMVPRSKLSPRTNNMETLLPKDFPQNNSLFELLQDMWCGTKYFRKEKIRKLTYFASREQILQFCSLSKCCVYAQKGETLRDVSPTMFLFWGSLHNRRLSVGWGRSARVRQQALERWVRAKRESATTGAWALGEGEARECDNRRLSVGWGRSARERQQALERWVRAKRERTTTGAWALGEGEARENDNRRLSVGWGRSARERQQALERWVRAKHERTTTGAWALGEGEARECDNRRLSVGWGRSARVRQQALVVQATFERWKEHA